MAEDNDGVARRLALLTNVQTGIRYHSRRQNSYDFYHRLVGVSSLILSSGAVAAMAASLPTSLTLSLAAAIAVAQSIDLIFEFRGKAELHRDLRGRYLRIEPQLLHRMSLTEEEAFEVEHEKMLVEQDEPPTIRRLIDICHNEVLHVLGYKRGDEGATFAETNRILRLLNWFRSST